MPANNKALFGTINNIIEQNPSMQASLSNIGIGKISTDNDLSKAAAAIAALPVVVANEFWTGISNKIVYQSIMRLFDSTPLKVFLDFFTVKRAKVGATREFTATELLKPKELTPNSPQDPFAVVTPKQWVHHIIVKKQQIFKRTKYEPLTSEAFTTGENLTRFLAGIISEMAAEVWLYYWSEVKDDILTSTTMKTVVIGKVADKATDLWKQIQILSSEMTFPSDKFNEGVDVAGTVTPYPWANTSKDKQVLLINPKNVANFNVDVIASLFNSSQLEGNQLKKLEIIFTKADGTAIPDADNTIGFLMDKKRYIWAMETFFASSIINPLGGAVTYALNTKATYGHIPFVNAVRLKVTP